VHDFDSHTSDLEEISRKVFSAHFGQLGLIFIWLSGCDTNQLFIFSKKLWGFVSKRTAKKLFAV
jgi:hypothetical protein